MSAIFSPKNVCRKGWLYNPSKQDEPDLINGIYSNQITPIAVDLTLHSIKHYPEDQPVVHNGEMDNVGYLLSKEERRLPWCKEITPDSDGVFSLEPKDGYYELIVQERVRVPKNAWAVCFLRSSLYRCGVFPASGALFDPGYDGAIHTFIKPSLPFMIHKDFRPLSIIFLKSFNQEVTYQTFWGKH